eukprot:PLAT3985.1.p2 GENE.PLAT3985.1~~PLAT3985.1.p2  ORF type:complete len:533 (+),score=366.96 PLAT3985.1:146-1744(+)
MLDLCEKEQLGVRIHAIRGLAAIAKDTEESAGKVADVLGQLLQSEVPLELKEVRGALSALVAEKPREVLAALFKHVGAEEGALRQLNLAFIRESMQGSLKGAFAADEELPGWLLEQVKAVMEGVSADDFKTLFSLLTRLPAFRKEPSELIGLIYEQAALDESWSPADEEAVERLVGCIKAAVPLFRRGGKATAFLQFFQDSVLPRLSEQEPAAQLKALQLLGSLVPHGTPATAAALLPTVYALMEAHIPSPPEGEGAAAPEIDFSFAEAVLFLFHHAAAACSASAVTALTGLNAKPRVFTGQPSYYADSGADAKAKAVALRARIKYLLAMNKTLHDQVKEQLKGEYKLQRAKRAAKRKAEKAAAADAAAEAAAAVGADAAAAEVADEAAAEEAAKKEAGEGDDDDDAEDAAGEEEKKEGAAADAGEEEKKEEDTRSIEEVGDSITLLRKTIQVTENVEELGTALLPATAKFRSDPPAAMSWIGNRSLKPKRGEKRGVPKAGKGKSKGPPKKRARPSPPAGGKKKGAGKKGGR